MEEINKEFRGIELAVIYPGNTVTHDLLQKLKVNMISALLGDRVGVTIIGPASVVRKVKRDPDKIQLFTHHALPSAGRRLATLANRLQGKRR